ncbi:MAG TPA: hemerythrin domain-containing protein [Candidatus Binataceae bacterium]
MANAVSLLKKDHETVGKLFKEVEQAEHGSSAHKKKAEIFGQIKMALEIHATIEEEIFYPAVKQARSEQVKDEVREAYEEHKQIKSLLAQLAGTAPSDETYDMKLKVLKEDVEHHVKEEEGEMFPDAKKYLGEKRLEALGEQLEARKQELAKGKGAAKPDSARASAASK